MAAPASVWRTICYALAVFVLSAARGGSAEVRISAKDSGLSTEEIAAILAQEEKAPESVILGEQPCVDWLLLSVSSVKLRHFELGRKGFSVHATLNPTGRVIKSAYVEGQEGDPQFHFLFNADTTNNITLTVMHRFLGNLETKGWELDLALNEDIGWVGKFAYQGSSGRELFGEIYSGLAVDQKLQQINSSALVPANTFDPLYDGPSNVKETQEYFAYIKNWFHYRLAGMKNEEVPGQGQLDAYYDRCIDPPRCELANGTRPSQTRIIGYAYAVRAMKNMVKQLKCGNAFRRNELGSNILNSGFWQEKPSKSIGLGDPYNTHAFVRPWFVRLLGDEVANDRQTQAFIRAQVQNFMDPQGFAVNKVGEFVTKVLHKVHFDMDISDKEAQEFTSKQSQILIDIMLPRSFEGVGHILQTGPWKKKHLVTYKAAFKKWRPAEWAKMTDLQQTILVSGLMDSLLFAGGLSVPTVLQQAIGVLYGFWGKGQLGDDFLLTKANLDQYVQEALRRFPAVGAFPFFDRETNAHNQIDLRAANLGNYSEGWGEDALNFTLRPMSEYKRKSISWGDFAMLNNDPADPGSRACPGRWLSITIINIFLDEFVRQGGQRCWEADKSPDQIWVNAGSATGFTLKAKDQCELS